MPATTVSGRTGGADVSIDGASYKSFLTSWRVLIDQPSSDVTTFNDEPNENLEPGPTRAFFDVAGIWKEGAANAGPIMPLPTNSALVFKASASNTISMTGDFVRAEAVRVANTPGGITGSGRSRSAIVFSFNRG